MYKLTAVAIMHKSHKYRVMTPADILDYIKYGTRKDERFIFVRVQDFGEFKRCEDALNAIKFIPDVYFSTWFDGAYDDYYHMEYEGILITEDDKPILFYNERRK